MSCQDEHHGQAAERQAKRQRRFVVYTTVDGEIRIQPDEESYLGTISPFFDPASLASAASTTSAVDDQDRFICAPSAFIVRCIALVTSFVEWQQLDEGKLKREYRARVAAMVRALAACPFDQTHALRLGMTERLRDMEATLEDHEGTNGANGTNGAYGADYRTNGAYGAGTEEANRLVGVTFPKNAGPSETRARAVLCAFFAVKCRGVGESKHKFLHIALCPHHFEIRHDAEVYDENNGDRVLVVRGRDSPHGCAIRSIEVVYGLASSVVIDLAEINRGRDEHRPPGRIAFKETAIVIGIMRIQKTRLQTRMQNVAVPDPAIVLRVEFLDAVALELANV